MSQPRPLTILAVGDLALNGRYLRHRLPPWQSVTAFWLDCDLRIGNLESPITSEPRFDDSKLVLRACPSAKDILTASNFDLLSLANNHAMDFGPAGLLETSKQIELLGIATVGSGPTLEEAMAPRIIEKRGHRIAVLSFCDVFQDSPLYATIDEPGVAPLGDASIDAVCSIRQSVDWVIVQLHWGTEMSQLPSPEQRALARRFVEAGADAIIGHHPHVLQPMEVIENVPVWYSLGNFAFSNQFWRGVNERGEKFVAEYCIHPLARMSGVIRFTLKKGCPPTCEFHPVSVRHDGKVVIDQSNEAVGFWKLLCNQLLKPSYRESYEREMTECLDRQRYQTSSRSFYRKMRLKAHQAGLLRTSESR